MCFFLLKPIGFLFVGFKTWVSEPARVDLPRCRRARGRPTVRWWPGNWPPAIWLRVPFLFVSFFRWGGGGGRALERFSLCLFVCLFVSFFGFGFFGCSEWRRRDVSDTRRRRNWRLGRRRSDRPSPPGWGPAHRPVGQSPSPVRGASTGRTKVAEKKTGYSRLLERVKIGKNKTKSVSNQYRPANQYRRWNRYRTALLDLMWHRQLAKWSNVMNSNNNINNSNNNNNNKRAALPVKKQLGSTIQWSDETEMRKKKQRRGGSPPYYQAVNAINESLKSNERG